MKLNDLKKAGILEFWSFIEHEPESDEIRDEAGKKNHIHLYCVPAKMIQTEDLRNEFIEFDPEFPDKPKKTLIFVRSNFSDWYLYAIHDEAYLIMKHEVREHHYSNGDLYASDFDDLNFFVSKTLKEYDLGPYVKIASYIHENKSFGDYVIQENIAPQQIYAYQAAWNILEKKGVYRNRRKNHEMIDEKGL